MNLIVKCYRCLSNRLEYSLGWPSSSQSLGRPSS